MIRSVKSLAIGAFVALVLVIYEDTARHTALAASAARNHQTMAFQLIWGFIGVTVISTAIAFVLFSVFAKPRRVAPAQRPWEGSYPGQGSWQQGPPARSRRRRAGGRRL